MLWLIIISFSSSVGVDRESRRLDKSGSTAVCLYIRELSNGSSRLLLSNVGDSRAIVFTCGTGASRVTSSESVSIESTTTKYWNYNSKKSLNCFRTGTTGDSVSQVIRGKYIFQPVLITQDHNLENAVEKDRVHRENPNPDWDLLPVNISTDFNELLQLQMEDKGKKCTFSYTLFPV